MNNADIRAKKESTICHIDVEAASMTKKVVGNDADFRRFIEFRVNNKAAKKFSDVPKDQMAIVAEVFRPQTENLVRFQFGSWTTDIVQTRRQNVFGHVYWLASGEKDQEGYGLHLIDTTVANTKYE